MRRLFLSMGLGLALAGCSQVQPVTEKPVMSENGVIRPRARPTTLNTDVRAVPAAARTVEDFDTTTSEQRTEAVAEAKDTSGEKTLGLTVATLGSPSEPGFWLKTPLVAAKAKGRVEYPEMGTSVSVDLIPIDGPRTGGSRMSLAAMRLIGAPLTGLPEVRVFKAGN